MNNEYWLLPAKVKWCRPQSADKFGKYGTQAYLTGEHLEKMRELQAEGVKNVIKKDEDGYYTNFSRPTQKVIRGKVVAFTPPEILDGRKPMPSGGYEPFKGNIGNGSDCVLKLWVYSHRVPNSDKTAKAIRWDAIRVDNLVPYERTDFTEAETKAVEGLDKAPSAVSTEPLW